MADFNKTFTEAGFDIIPIINQGDADTDITGDWINMKNYDRCTFLIAKYGTEDVDALGFQVVEATSDGGTAQGVSALYNYWYKIGTLTSQTVWTAGRLTTADDIVGVGSAAPTNGTWISSTTDADTSAFLIMLDVQREYMSVNDGYDWLTLQVEGDGVNNACLISAWAILQGSRFPQLTPLSAIS